MWAMSKILSPAAVLITSVILSACQSPLAPTGQLLVSRWITAEPARIFTVDGVREVEEVFSWTLASAADLAPWKQSQQLELPLRQQGRSLVVSWSEKRPRLIRSVDLEAGSVDAIAVVVEGLKGGRLRLFWAGENQPFDQTQDLVLSARKSRRGGPESFRFDLSSHPAWRGRIARLGLAPILPGEGQLRLMAIRGLKYSVSPERLREAARRAWKVDLDHEVRNALLAVPGIPVMRETAIPAGGVLRFGFGAVAPLGGPIRFRVSAAVGDSEPQVLFENTLWPSQPAQSGRWHDAAVDLSAFSGRPVRLWLETRSSAPEHGGFGFWAGPRITEPETNPGAPNVVLIVVDTLRADRLSLYGYERETTPRIDSWARRRAVTFRHAIAPAPWTLPSHVSLFTGLNAIAHGLNHNLSTLPAGSTLAERLRTAGYSTMAITGGVYLHPRYGFHQGFDRFRYWPSERPQSKEIEHGVARALEWVAGSRERPFFLFFHTYETHLPFHARRPFIDRLAPDLDPAELKGRIATGKTPEAGFTGRRRFFLKTRQPGVEKEPLPDSALPMVNALYDSGVAYADYHLGRLLSRLEESDLAKQTLVILTSDHGEALGEKGLAAHAYLYDFNLMVPLIVSLPDGVGAGRTISRQVRLIDVLPTVLDSVGLDAPGQIDGVSVLPLIDDPGAPFPGEAWSYASSTNFGISLRISNRLKYIFDNSAIFAAGAANGSSELYDLAKDPDEEINLAVREAAQAEELRELVARRYEQSFQGLRIDFFNAGTAAYGVRLTGKELLSPFRTKAMDPSGPLVSWQPGGRLDTTVAAASSFSLFVEGIGSGSRINIEVEGAGITPGCSAIVDLSLLESPLWLACDASSCETRRTTAPAAATGIAFQLTSTFTAMQAPETIDPELKEKLQALGYLN